MSEEVEHVEAPDPTFESDAEDNDEAKKSPTSDFGSTPAGRMVVPAVLAWVLTVLIPSLGSAGTWASRVIATLAAAPMVFAYVREKQIPKNMYVACIWAFAGLSSVVWALQGHTPGRPGVVWGFFGALAWGVFAYAAATPPTPSSDGPVEGSAPRAVRPPYLLVSIVGAIAFQMLGWGFLSAERELLIRVSAVGLGLLVIGVGVRISLEQELFRVSVPDHRRTKSVVVALLSVSLALLVGIAFWVIR